MTIENIASKYGANVKYFACNQVNLEHTFHNYCTGWLKLNYGKMEP